MKMIITTGKRMPGARLSYPGNWGNMPYPSVEAAEQAARAMGATHIDYERGR